MYVDIGTCKVLSRYSIRICTFRFIDSIRYVGIFVRKENLEKS
jgi:hypothetical protein